MKPIALFFLKTFLFMGIGFALVSGLLDLVFDGHVDLWKSLYRLVFFGTVMTLVMGLSQIYGLNKLGVKAFTAENLAVKQKRIVLSSLSLQDILTKLKTDPHLKKMEATEDGNRILLNSDISWIGWGEKISIQALHASDTGTEYEIMSEPKLGTTLMDSGKNLQNVMWVEKMLG